MFTIRAITLDPVRQPTMSIKIWFVLFWLNLLITVIVMKERIPPPMKVIPIYKPATAYVISSRIKAYANEAKLEKII